MSGGDGAAECAAGSSGERADDHHEPETHEDDRNEEAAGSSGGRAREQSLAGSPSPQFLRVRYARQQPSGRNASRGSGDQKRDYRHNEETGQAETGFGRQYTVNDHACGQASYCANGEGRAWQR